MFELFLENRATVQKLVVVLLFLGAWWRGGGPERACSAVLVGMIVVQLALRDFTGLESNYMSLDPVMFSIDCLGLAGFVIIALKANRFYPLVLAATQLVAFLAHLVRVLVEPVSSLAYYLLIAMPFWFQIIVLAVGLGRHVLRRSQHGYYADWRRLAPRQQRPSLS